MSRQAYINNHVLGADCEAVTFYDNSAARYRRVTFRTTPNDTDTVPHAHVVVEQLGFNTDALGARAWEPVDVKEHALVLATALYLLPELRAKHKAGSVTPVE